MSIVRKGTSKGTVTDGSGEYSLRVPASGGLLVFRWAAAAAGLGMLLGESHDATDGTYGRVAQFAEACKRRDAEGERNGF